MLSFQITTHYALIICVLLGLRPQLGHPLVSEVCELQQELLYVGTGSVLGWQEESLTRIRLKFSAGFVHRTRNLRPVSRCSLILWSSSLLLSHPEHTLPGRKLSIHSKVEILFDLYLSWKDINSFYFSPFYIAITFHIFFIHFEHRINEL